MEFLSTETLTGPRKPGGMQRLPEVVRRGQRSSNQGEPEWLLLRLSEKTETV